MGKAQALGVVAVVLGILGYIGGALFAAWHIGLAVAGLSASVKPTQTMTQ